MTLPHVLHVVPGLLPGGMELTMARLISALTVDGMRHSVVCLKGEPEIAGRMPPSTDIHCLRSKPNDLRLPARLARLIGQIQPTVIHARNWGAWPDVSLSRLFASPVAPLVLSFHGLGKAGYMPARRRIASWVLARMATSLLTVSNQSKELMVAKWGWPRHKVNVIPNGVDVDRFQPVARDRSGERAIVGNVAALLPKKNQAMLIDACGQLIRRGLDIELRVAGEGPERGNLIARAKSAGLSDRLKLLGHVTDVPTFLQSIDVFALSSDTEEHPNAMNEAMACGVACVSTTAGCAREQLDNGRCGRIVPLRDASSMAEALEGLITDPDARHSLGAAARRRACEYYSFDKMLKSYESLYNRIASSGRKTN